MLEELESAVADSVEGAGGQQIPPCRSATRRNDKGNWETVFEYEGANNDRELTIRDIDMEVE